MTDIFPAQHNTPSPLGIPWPSCSASPAASWVVQLDLGEGWLSGESHSGPKPRCGTALLCTGQLTDWEPWLSTSAPETVPSVQGPAGDRTSRLSHQNNAIRGNGIRGVLSEVCDHSRLRQTEVLLIWTERKDACYTATSVRSLSGFAALSFALMHKQNEIKLRTVKCINVLNDLTAEIELYTSAALLDVDLEETA